MTVDVVSRAPADVEADALLVGLAQDAVARLPGWLAPLDRRLGGLLRSVLDAERFTGKPGQLTHLHTGGKLAAARLIVVGLGPKQDGKLELIRRAAAAGVRRARDLGARRVAIELLGDRLTVAQRAQATVEGALLGTYTFERYKREKSERVIESLRLVVPAPRMTREANQGVRRGQVFARATALARDLINEPANEANPRHLADVAARIGRETPVTVKVFDRPECEKLGMGAFLGVAAGSQQPPKFIHLSWTPKRRARKKVVVIGKGVTFDAGGLDLKSADGMQRMKNDMSGAAAVLAVMQALPELDPAVEVHGLIAATENMPSGTALRPGDILKAMNGTTIEVGNTDAEGRLTLADALCYANDKLKPDEIIDLATLTGACVVALGPLCAGLFASDRGLAERLLGAAEQAGERVWQLPLIDEYRDNLKSEVADLNNVGPRGGGAITAALFLREFAGSTPWAHLDIAGPAFSEKDLPLAPKGGTGVAVRTLLAYLTS